jgi:hypothetical protein
VLFGYKEEKLCGSARDMFLVFPSFTIKNSKLKIGGRFKTGPKENILMSDENSQKGTPDPERVKVLSNLPKEIVEQLSKEEVNAFLFEDLWPDSLRDKLKDFME